MSNPLALLPLALAAGGGRIGAAGAEVDYEVQQLVAAGVTLLQRSAPLVRALNGRRSAILLPTSPAFIAALAASEGRAAVLLDPHGAPAEIAYQCDDAGVGAVFTTSALASRAPDGMPVVLLDDAPRSAQMHFDGRTRSVDLGSHFGLSLEGERDAAGREEAAVIVYPSEAHGGAASTTLTHRDLIANARSTRDALGISTEDHVLAMLPFAQPIGLTVGGSAPLLSGARVTAIERVHAADAAKLLTGDITIVVAAPDAFQVLLAAIGRGTVSVRAGALRLCVCGGAVSVELQERWHDATGVELRDVSFP